MTEQPEIQCDEFAISAAVNDMWKQLAEQIRAAIPDIVTGCNTPERAIVWATCAEACFWKATGDLNTHDINDVMQYYMKSVK